MASHSPLRFKNRLFYALVAAASLVVLTGLYAAHLMDTHGHIITGMNNQIVWGIPHVFAIFMIVAASGVLNVASIGSVFGKTIYKSRAPLAGLLSIALLAGGLTVLMLDLGRPDRIIVAATHYNLTSVFAWNVLLYTGMFTTVAIYLWTIMERRMNPWTKSLFLNRNGEWLAMLAISPGNGRRCLSPDRHAVAWMPQCGVFSISRCQDR